MGLGLEPRLRLQGPAPVLPLLLPGNGEEGGIAMAEVSREISPVQAPGSHSLDFGFSGSLLICIYLHATAPEASGIGNNQ